MKIKRALVAPLVALLVVVMMASCASREAIKKRPYNQHSKPAKTGYLKSAKPYTIMGVTYYPLADAYGYDKTGIASWYGKKFHGRKTANGEVYNMYGISAAHKTLPLGTMVEVTRLDNRRKMVLRVNDRGPFVANRIIDLSYGAAKNLGIVTHGTTRVRVVALAKGRPNVKRNAPPIAVEPPPDLKRGNFWIQVGAFGVAANAERVRERLLFPQDRIRLQKISADGGMPLIRVQVGPYYDLDKADAALNIAVRQGYGHSFIVAQ